MKTLEYIRWADPPWWATLARLLPLWFLSLALTTEGFPRPTIPDELAIIFLILTPVIIVALLWIRWLTPELLLYIFFPITLLFILDEISTTYKTPLILTCTVILSAGMIGYQLCLNRNSLGWAWLTLLLTVILTWIFASHASRNYWQMASDLGYQCSPDAQDCAPLTGNETPWWVLFFKP